MPYKVRLVLVGGERLEHADIYHQTTPNVGDRITVNIANGATRAQVSAIHKYPSKSPGTAVEAVDVVDAQEL